jgi:Transposase DDE domain
MDDFNAELLSRLPLAEAVILTLSHIGQPTFLEDFYERNRGRTFTKVLSFPVLVQLLTDALVQHHGSGKQSFARAAEQDRMPVTDSAAYRKLGRIPLPLSQAFLAEMTDRLEPLGCPTSATLIPASLQAMTLVPLDGKKIKKVAKRIKALRGLPGAVLGAKVLVALRLDSGQAIAFHADPDGEVNDCPLVPGLLSQIRCRTSGPRLFIADRQFCGTDQLDLFAAEGDHYLVRRTTTARFTPDTQRPGREGIDARGRRYVESWGQLGTGKKSRYVRQITLERPGEETITLVTDLLDGEMFPASDLLEAYLMRWEIERVFQQITEVFDLQSLIGGTPEAVVFQCGFCLLLYNVLQVIRRLLAEVQEQESDSISTEQVFYDARRELVSLATLGDPATIAERYSEPTTPQATRGRLLELLSKTWSNRWLKAAPKKKQPARARTKQSGAHTSVSRAQKAYKEAKERDRSRRGIPQ